MKKLLMAIILLSVNLFISQNVFATASVFVAWNDHASDKVVGYKIFFATTPQVYSDNQFIYVTRISACRESLCSYLVKDLAEEQTWNIALKAVDINGFESINYSDDVSVYIQDRYNLNGLSAEQITNLSYDAHNPVIGSLNDILLVAKAQGLPVQTALPISNIGDGDLDWRVSSESSILSLSSSMGLNNGTVTITANVDGLEPGDYYEYININSSTAANSPFIVRVKVSVLANTASLDLESSDSQYLSIEDGSQAGLDLSTALTFENWVNFETLPAPGHVMVLQAKDDRIAGSGNSQRSVVWYIYNNGGTYVSQLFVDSKGNVNDGSYDFLSSNVLLTANTWNHLAVTWVGSSKTAKFYVNGIQVGQAVGSHVSSLYNSTGPYTIGAYSDGYEPLDGMIDEVSVWNYARSGTEIKDNYRTKRVGNEIGLHGYWGFDDSDLSDKSPNVNNLINNNGAMFAADRP